MTLISKFIVHFLVFGQRPCVSCLSLFVTDTVATLLVVASQHVIIVFRLASSVLLS